MLLRARDLLVWQRSQLANAFRAQMGELSIISPLGMASVAKLADKVRDPDIPLPPVARIALLEIVEQIDLLSDRIERLGQEVRAGVNADEIARRLTSILGVGPLIAATVRANVNDIGASKPEETSPHGYLHNICTVYCIARGEGDGRAGDWTTLYIAVSKYPPRPISPSPGRFA